MGDTSFRDEKFGATLSTIMRTVEGGRTFYLSVDGDIEVLLRTTTLEWWKELIYLRNRPMYHFHNSTRFETFAQFPSEHRFCFTSIRVRLTSASLAADLKTLHLSMAIFSFDRSNLFLEPSFSRLRGLVVSSRPVIRGKIEAIQGMTLSDSHAESHSSRCPSPESASSGPAELFGHLVPQITSLALSGVTKDYSDSALFRLVGQCSNLKYLSLSIESDDLESLLFTDAAGMQLESPHMSPFAIDASATLLPRLIALAKGETETIRAKRVVFYEEEESLSASRTYMVDSEVFEWVTDRVVPPLEDFDGR